MFPAIVPIVAEAMTMGANAEVFCSSGISKAIPWTKPAMSKVPILMSA